MRETQGRGSRKRGKGWIEEEYRVEVGQSGNSTRLFCDHSPELKKNMRRS